VRPIVWNEPPDEERIQKALDEEIPRALDYLEGELPEGGFLFGNISVADISLASFFRNGSYAGFEADKARWPRTSAFVERTLAHPCFSELLKFEDVQRSVEIRSRRQALLDAGAPLTQDTMGLREPRRGTTRL
jgi:glutathione S-transferase